MIPGGKRLVWPALLVLLAAGIALSLSVGPVRNADAWIILRLRLPRAALAVLAGGSLAVSGCVLQALLRNELATPYTLGISAGAGLAAGSLIIFHPAVPIILSVSAGFGGALAAAFAVWLISRSGGGGDAARILLAGATVNLMGASVLLLFEYFSPASRLVEIVRWMMGDLSAVDSTVPLFILPFALIGASIVAFRTGTLNQLAMGSDLASARGVRVGFERNVLILASSLLAGATVGAVGPVGFVGLIVPHAMRRLSGSDYRTLVPASAVGGMVLLLFADVVSRIVASPAEIPIGIVMALAGGPFFLFLLYRDRRMEE
ncbi:iron ABC transporter permease [Candidatus Fermentibacteria bacterium]|nr:iron ABC transporter permease [Candidatus Fermentibacteria bacterium]